MVEDDGVGFDPRSVSRAHEEDSFGLSHLRRRAAELGAELTVESEPGSGTAVNVRLPLPRETAARARHRAGTSSRASP